VTLITLAVQKKARQLSTSLGGTNGRLLRVDEARILSAQDPNAVKGCEPVQLTRRVSSTSVTAISAIGLEANDQIGRT
jgi:hypothetical protein